MIVGAVVEIEAKEGKSDAEGLHRGRVAAKPDNRDDDNEDAFDEGGDTVGDGGDEREENKGEDVLPEVEDAVEEELEGKVRSDFWGGR